LRRLEASIRQFGQPRPILVCQENRMIVAGHGVKIAMERAEQTQIRVILRNVD